MISILTSLIEILKTCLFFTTSYSNNVFPDPLTKEEEESCIKKLLLNKDKDARNMLIEHNLRLVAHIAKKFDNNKNLNDDLISIGTIGLIKGVDSYSLKHGTKITTYCARCIENEILMYFRSNKKNDSNISLDDKIGFDKEGNEITILDVLKTPMPMFDEVLETKEIEYVDKNLKVKDGYVEFSIKHCSIYFLTGAVVNNAKGNPKTLNRIIVALGLFIFALAAIMLFSKK